MLFRDAESKGNTADHLSRPARSLANCTTRCVRSLANCRAREPRSLANCDNHEARGLANCLVRCARSLANCRRRDSREVIEPTAQVSIVAGQRSRVPRSANLPRATSRPISLTTLSYAAHTCGRGRRPRGNRNSARGCRHERYVRQRFAGLHTPGSIPTRRDSRSHKRDSHRGQRPTGHSGGGRSRRGRERPCMRATSVPIAMVRAPRHWRWASVGRPRRSRSCCRS
jgi:hypothetical protein